MSLHSPPKRLLRFFRWFCHPDFVEDIEGDLHEKYERHLRKHKKRKAWWLFLRDVLSLFRIGLMRPVSIHQNLIHPAMFRHNFKISLRSFMRYKSSFVINLMGLSLGLACTLLISLWVLDERQVDQFHESGKQLVQVLENRPTPNGIETEVHTQGPLAKALSAEMAEVEYGVSLVPYEWFEGEQLILSDGKEGVFISKNQFASADFFKIFSYPLLHGNNEQVLQEKNAVVISEDLALKMFNTTNAVGETIEWIHDEFGNSYQVTGVFQSLAHNSTAQFDAVFHYDAFMEEYDNLEGWQNSDPFTYLKLHPNTELAAFNLKIKDFLKGKNGQSKETLLAQVYGERYLNDVYENGVLTGGRIAYLRLFSLIAFFILLIASVNFINMSTAKATTRMKEIGVKKTMGAQRTNLFFQYLTESTLITLLSLLFAFALVFVALPYFNNITGKEMVFNWNTQWLLGAFVIAFLTGIISGSYPALYLSGFTAIKAFKGNLDKSVRGQFARKGLVIFQFVIVAMLIVSVVVVYQQIQFIQSKNLGYNKDNIIWFTTGILPSDQQDENADGLTEAHIEQLLQQLKNTVGVANASNFAHNMVDEFGTTTGVDWAGKAPDQSAQFAQVSGGYDFIETMGIELLEGRSYSRSFQNEKEKIILNETAIQAMGMEEPVGKIFKLWDNDKEIIAVAKDFHFDDFYQNIQPLFLKLDVNNFASNIMVKLEAGNQKETIERIGKVYKNFFISGMPFEFQFLDDNYQRLYAQEIRVSQLSKYAAGIAIFIACLGLFGFATFTVQRRLKEIAIRKVLGSSMLNVVSLLLRSFLSLVGLALLVALPLSYLFAKKWLEDFAFHIDLELWFFVLAGGLVLLLTLVAVGMQTIQAAGVQPVEHIQGDN